MAVYANTQLDPSRREIRLLSVLPGRFDDHIQCYLLKTSLDSFEILGNAVLASRRARLAGKEACFPSTIRYSVELLQWSGYEALSYTWGSNTNDFITIKDHQRLQVTDNLAAALRRLRRRVEPRWLWIDAICIDQNNLVEKSHQIHMMGEIYRRANNVLIWLGEPNVMMRKPVHGFACGPGKRIRKSLRARRNLPLRLLVETLEKSSSRWWDRTWVIQEYAMAAGEPFVLYGPCELFWSNFLDMVMQGIDTGLLDPGFFPNPGERAYYIEGFSFFHEDSSIIDLATILKKTKCQDPRDKLYAMLSLMNKYESRHISPNYSKPCSEVYAIATFAALHSDQSCRALHVASLGSSTMEGLPSWAIDFSSEGSELDLSHLSVVSRKNEDSPLCPSSARESNTRIPIASVSSDRVEAFMGKLQRLRRENFKIDISSDARLLAISGRVIDQVRKYIELPISREYQQTEESVSALRQLYRALHHLGRRRRAKTVAEERPAYCLEGDHRKDCVYFHASLCSRFHILLLIVSEESDLSDSEVVSVFNALYTSFCSDAGGKSSEIMSVGRFPLPWREAWNDHYRWLYLDRLKHGLVFFITTTGLIGCATTEVMTGDTIGILDNSKSPCVLRRVGLHYKFHGFVYVESPATGDLSIYEGDHNFEDTRFLLC